VRAFYLNMKFSAILNEAGSLVPLVKKKNHVLHVIIRWHDTIPPAFVYLAPLVAGDLA
jgi:hypothetical protein